MSLPIVAIVGRPNVGKSTLFNRLVGQPLAIVHDAPGVTRDRHYADADLHGREISLVDTGGFDPTTDDPMGQGIARQVRAAIAEADVLLCVLDASLPPTGPDRDALQLLRKSGKPVIVAGNKVDGLRAELASAELYRLGVDQLYPISALHGRGTAELAAAIVAALPPPSAAPPPEPLAEDVARVTLLGRPNAGKSSLFNRLAGEERALVDHRPGTTRDTVDSPVHFAGRDFLVVDTAGIRRRARIDEDVEAISVMRALRSVGRADVVLVMVDAHEGLAEQDQRLLGLAAERGRAIVVGLNKFDLLGAAERRRAEQEARRALGFAPWAPLHGLSAKTGAGVGPLMKAVWEASRAYRQRIGTAELNRFFEEVLERRPPPTHQGRAPRLYYITQVSQAPPVFAVMCSHPDALKESYKRFVGNQLRERFGFTSVPLLLRFRDKRRKRHELA